MYYFTKWVEAILLQNQTAASVTQAITKICNKYIWHSFYVYSTFQSRMQFQESHASANVKLFGMQISHTTAYHSQSNGMMEQFNHSLLQMLRYYTSSGEDWETYILLVFYAYHTAPHSMTGVSPSQIMFCRDPKQATFPQTKLILYI